ncbi:hypothetical protein OB962_22180 [Aeromonas piscicola]|uniref:Uncharacterized protein n=1 Tax=Aeromonas piscicola TaxID=600645 RepID=A0ABT7QIA0_9GAMM|nr:hypothetical protein [Aeromonas piscicola]MDM5133679.1 hypothetical protein [Aeromonas piscicola]
MQLIFGGTMYLAIDLATFGHVGGSPARVTGIDEVVAKARKGILINQLQPAAVHGLFGIQRAHQGDGAFGRCAHYQ